MSVSCGIVGLSNVGKSTIFNALTAAGVESGNYPFSTTNAQSAVVDVPDPNLEAIAKFIETKKLVPAAVNVVDIAGLTEGASKGEGMGNKFLASIRECDAIMQIVRCFENPNVVREDPVDAAKDIEVVEVELCMADYETVTRAIERVSKKARTGDKESIEEKELFERAQTMLEEGRLVRTGDWTPHEVELLRPLCLMSQKRILYVANVGDDDLAGEGKQARAVRARAEETGSEWLALCGDLESELRSMSGEDREVFMAEYGIKKLGLDRLIHAAYRLLGLQTFYTAGPMEVRAWTIRAGDKAPVAAGVIHTDFEKGFIRAQVYQVTDLVEHETENAIKAAGKLRTEGRDYVMQDEDVCHFLTGK
ncbi:MAG: redox-regulated ATPase YchF [bacterium]|nr:redox-regulated ATPase YchF [bacterium]